MIANFLKHGSNTALLAALAVWGGLALADVWPVHPGFIVLGGVLFFLSEYGYHRFAFHAKPMRAVPFILRLQHRLHYDHHVEPDRLDLLFLPLWFLIPNLAVTGGLVALIWPNLSVVASIIAGAMLAILYYEWVHYVAHIPYRPRTRWGRWIKKYHLWHHFKNERLWFGVTNPSFDLAMRTYARPDDVARSATTRNIHGT
ncbi:sterol desaturase family protein [Acidiphilium sp. AL]|uniref:Sterol desaturase family protein n=1 Tax=Acidiphilium iwatense TaxID=768198 RepID=A0ABS9DZA1_9PROT|nr:MULTISPECIES: sterol desaturase family protein [Acidiphilium]MCF3947006.1 sterol desaturase family protein [Acidiphilium iwatense]MCU4160318.1 sterol desaturase family protein [Acidiphilium sp. AL]